MVKKIFAAIAAAVIVSGFNCAFAQSDSTVVVDDFAYAKAIHEKTFNYDTRSVKLKDGSQVLLESRRNNGSEIGAFVGVDYFNEVITPTFGGEIGYHGRRFGLWANASIGRGEYNNESNRAGDTYVVTNFGLDGGVRLFDLPSKYLHQREVWLLGSFGYKLRKDEKESFTEGMEGSLQNKVQGSSMTFGAGIKVDFKNHMKATNWYIKAMAYSGHEYYMQRGHSEVRFGASLTVGFNFVVPSRHSYNDKAINKLFGSRAKYKAAIR